ncbi:MAG: hypothetical protein ACFFBL_04540 [Promethearchaeota archaeon]
MNRIITKFKRLLSIIESSQAYYDYFKALKEEYTTAQKEGIIDNFGLLSIRPWWWLVFRTDNARGAFVFIKFFQKFRGSRWEDFDADEIKHRDIKRFLKKHWGMDLPDPPDPDKPNLSGTGPWIPPGAPTGGGGGAGGGNGEGGT